MVEDDCPLCHRPFERGDAGLRTRMSSYYDERNDDFINLCWVCDQEITASGRGDWWVADIVYFKRLKEFYSYKMRIVPDGA